MSKAVLVFDFLAADSVLVEHEWKDHNSLQKEAPADSHKLGGVDVHDPGRNHGRVADQIQQHDPGQYTACDLLKNIAVCRIKPIL